MTTMIEEGALIGQQTKQVLRRFGKRRGNIVAILQRFQSQLGYLPREAMLEIVEFLSIPETDVYSVVTFYNQLRLSPRGWHSVRVCLGTACHIKGAP